MKRARSPNMSTLIRDLLETAHESPEIINPIKDKTNLDVLMNALEISGNERIEYNEKFRNHILSRLDNLEKGLDLIMEKMKIPKREREKVKGKSNFENIIFE